MKRMVTGLLLILVAAGCEIIRKSPKTSFTSGFYSQKSGDKKQIVFTDIEDENVVVYDTYTQNDKRFADTTQNPRVFKPETGKTGSPVSFNKHSFDVDFLTMPLKYRPARAGVPRQLNTNLNGALYLGYRTDKFSLGYHKSPLSIAERTINHYGFSLGGFTGLGNTAINPTTTNNTLNTEYDGIVWIKGMSGIIAINNFTLGISLGFDHLLDKNRQVWVYEGKPWLGLAFGLNLN
jgi:hypothetical protein